MKLVRGVGLNDTNYKKLGCPFYQRWCDMLTRCYSDKFKANYPSYEGVSVCKEWLTFSNFKAWMEKQNWEGRSLDKDILTPNNKVYGPMNCRFIPGFINNLILTKTKGRGIYPIGVYFTKIKENSYYVAVINTGNKQQRIGYYKTPFEAHRAWQFEKSKQIQERVVFWRSTDPLSFDTGVADSLIKRSWDLLNDLQNNQETTLL